MHDPTGTTPATGPHAHDRGIDGIAGYTWPHVAADALRFWERHRVTYNAVLVLVVSTVFLVHWPEFSRRVSVDLFLALFLLGVLANVAYCAAYPADLFVQHSGLGAGRRRGRWALLLTGTLFASVLAQFIARGMVGGA